MFPRVQNIEKPSKCVADVCSRCGGDGIYRKMRFPGTCYGCGGSGRHLTLRVWGFPVSWTDEQCQKFESARVAKNQAAQAQREEKRQAARDSQRAANFSRFPELSDLFAILATLDMHDQTVGASFERDITEEEVDVLKSMIERRQARDEARREKEAREILPPEGRREIAGRVLSVKRVETQWGDSIKMVVDCDSYRLYGTVPSKLRCEVGHDVKFTATVQAKEKGFGFYSRPKA